MREKRSFFNTSVLTQWNPKVCWIHLFDLCTAYLFSSEIHLWHRPLQSHPPFSLSWRQIPLTSPFLLLSLLCPLYSSVIWRSLLSVSSPQLFFLSVEKGKMWIPGVLGNWNAFCAARERLPGPGPFSAPAFSFPRCGPEPLTLPPWGAAVTARFILFNTLLFTSFSKCLVRNIMYIWYIWHPALMCLNDLPKWMLWAPGSMRLAGGPRFPDSRPTNDGGKMWGLGEWASAVDISALNPCKENKLMIQVTSPSKWQVSDWNDCSSLLLFVLRMAAFWHPKEERDP